MKTIELTEEAYAALLEMKNQLSDITNPTMSEYMHMIKDENEVMICGGASVYKQFLPLAQKLYITEVHAKPEGDTFFTEINMAEWKEISRQDHKADEKNKYDYSFVILERI